MYIKSSNKPRGGLLNFGPSGGQEEGGLEGGLLERGAYLKFFDR